MISVTLTRAIVLKDQKKKQNKTKKLNDLDILFSCGGSLDLQQCYLVNQGATTMTVPLPKINQMNNDSGLIQLASQITGPTQSSTRAKLSIQMEFFTCSACLQWSVCVIDHRNTVNLLLANLLQMLATDSSIISNRWSSLASSKFVHFSRVTYGLPREKKISKH